MIPRIKHQIEEADWKKLFQNGLNDLNSLADYLNIPKELLLPVGYSQSDLEIGFPSRIPLPYAARMNKGDIEDPLLKQVLPNLLEQKSHPLFVNDPLQEANYNPVSGMLHKYQSRALLVASGACPIHCRYCFRRNFPYSDNNPGKAQWENALHYIREDKNINEVILSGGDPLSLPDAYLSWLTAAIEEIPHIKRLRLHTRFPVVIPQRITQELLALLSSCALQKVVVLHINHANEIDDSVINACIQLKQAGITLLNQSVLLKGINDQVEALVTLSERLFDAGILPYYLHMPDKVAGTAHFDIDDDDGKRLHTQMQGLLPGFLVPKLVREIPGETSKTLI